MCLVKRKRMYLAGKNTRGMSGVGSRESVTEARHQNDWGNDIGSRGKIVDS